MDELDRAIVNRLQGGFPLCARPFAAAAAELGTDEATLIARIGALLANGTLTRFGPLYDAERMGGAFTLCALCVPEDDFERVAARVNAHAEVAHNYARDHAFNMWFVLATAAPAGIARVIGAIEAETGLTVYDFPREAEYFIDLRLAA
ncbi:MAG: AsnC family transcriptional regulator [Betaproteobacteria bacterium]|jgi:DNA-binding Lrp family transcriptional regulator|nr:AsnC family transcriptional regulator [Betaproteobacteria bacterium]